jgi:hypothetical protein
VNIIFGFSKALFDMQDKAFAGRAVSVPWSFGAGGDDGQVVFSRKCDCRLKKYRNSIPVLK